MANVDKLAYRVLNAGDLLGVFCGSIVIFGVVAFVVFLVVDSAKKFKCWFRHDWQVIERERASSLERCWRTSHGGTYRLPEPEWIGEPIFIDRVCLRCGRRDNQIEAWLKSKELALETERRRQAKAKEIAQGKEPS